MFLALILSIISEFLHHEYLVRHPKNDKAVILKLRQICVVKEIMLSYVILAAIATQISYIISVVCAIILLFPVYIMLNLIDAYKSPSKAKEDSDSNRKSSPQKIDSNRIYPTSSTKLDPLSDFKD